MWYISNMRPHLCGPHTWPSYGLFLSLHAGWFVTDNNVTDFPALLIRPHTTGGSREIGRRTLRPRDILDVCVITGTGSNWFSWHIFLSEGNVCEVRWKVKRQCPNRPEAIRLPIDLAIMQQDWHWALDNPADEWWRTRTDAVAAYLRRPFCNNRPN